MLWMISFQSVMCLPNPEVNALWSAMNGESKLVVGREQLADVAVEEADCSQHRLVEDGDARPEGGITRARA